MADMMTNARKVADAIARVAREHGVPNGTTPADLATHYGAPGALLVGRVLSQYRGSLSLELRAHGLRLESVEAFQGTRVVRFAKLAP